MMIGEPARLVPNIQIPSWESDPFDFNDSISGFASISTPFSLSYNTNGGSCDPSSPLDSPASLYPYISNDFTSIDFESLSDELGMPVDAFSGDHFRMFDFKVRKCTRARSHDWTQCPYAHPGEKARRRDPRKYHYSGNACPEFRKGNCRKGESCEFAHGVFECWLHPARYRTQPCKDGRGCRRRVCFFAHTPEQLRVLSHGSGDSSDGSSGRLPVDSHGGKGCFVTSPTSTLAPPPLDSPPTSPTETQYKCNGVLLNSESSLLASMRNLQIGKNPNSWGFKMGYGFGSIRGSNLQNGFFSLAHKRFGFGHAEPWDHTYEEEPIMERVESGRDLRAKIYAKLGKENSLGRVEMGNSISTPDVGWISELVK